MLAWYLFFFFFFSFQFFLATLDFCNSAMLDSYSSLQTGILVIWLTEMTEQIQGGYPKVHANP